MAKAFSHSSFVDGNGCFDLQSAVVVETTWLALVVLLDTDDNSTWSGVDIRLLNSSQLFFLITASFHVLSAPAPSI